MSNEIEAIKDPGLLAHVHRRADTDPKAAKKAERQVAILFLLSALGTITLIGSYIFIPQDLTTISSEPKIKKTNRGRPTGPVKKQYKFPPNPW